MAKTTMNKGVLGKKGRKKIRAKQNVKEVRTKCKEKIHESDCSSFIAIAFKLGLNSL